MKEYEGWKRQPEHFFENPLNIVDKDGRLLTRIMHKEFIEEKKVEFQNWKQNKRITLVKKDDKTETVLVPFFTDKDMNQEWLRELIKTCEEQWKGQPKHFLELQKEWIEKHKKEYETNLGKIKEEYALILEKYDYLAPVFRLINADVFD